MGCEINGIDPLMPAGRTSYSGGCKPKQSLHLIRRKPLNTSR